MDFLAELDRNNTRDWFNNHREAYESCYVEPARCFVVAAGELLREISPTIHAEPRILGSIFRINRDTRFSKDKRPYKAHIDFWFWEGDRKAAVSGFFVRISPAMVGIGAGCHGFDARQQPVFQEAVSRPDGRAEVQAIESVLRESGYQLIGGATPRTRQLYVHVDAPPGEALQPELVETCARHWRKFAPLHRWLVDRVQEPLIVREGNRRT